MVGVKGLGRPLPPWVPEARLRIHRDPRRGRRAEGMITETWRAWREEGSGALLFHPRPQPCIAFSHTASDIQMTNS